jgi:hypothetical protein
MTKRGFLVLTALIFCVFVAACAKSEPVNLVEYAKACDAANNGKSITVQGFIAYGDKTPCLTMMRDGMKRDCAFKFLDTVNVVGKEPVVYLREGKENNQAETPETSMENAKPTGIFEKEQVKFRLNDGTVVEAREKVSTPVTLTGEVSVTDRGAGETVCAIFASKIEKR